MNIKKTNTLYTREKEKKQDNICKKNKIKTRKLIFIIKTKKKKEWQKEKTIESDFGNWKNLKNSFKTGCKREKKAKKIRWYIL